MGRGKSTLSRVTRNSLFREHVRTYGMNSPLFRENKELSFQKAGWDLPGEKSTLSRGARNSLFREHVGLMV